MHRSFIDKEWIDIFIQNNHHELPAEVVMRFFSVVRIKPDEMVAVFDGGGRQVVGTLAYEKAHKRAHFTKASLEVSTPTKPQLIVVQASLEEAKLSETIKRGSEIGVDHVVIFEAERSEPFSYKKALAKHERLLRVAQDACRQSGRLFVPTITFKASLMEYVKESPDKSLGVFGAVTGEKLLTKALKEQGGSALPIVVVVGPEGGLSVGEEQLLRQAQWQGVRWAPFTLRSELAGVFAMAIIQGALGRA